jgi:hypothetical protein
MASIVAELAGEIQSEQTDIAASHHKIPSVSTANLPGAGGGTNAAVTAVNGMLVYNTTLGMLQQYAAGIWSGITTAPVITSFQYSDGASATAEKTVIVSLSCGTQSSTTVTAASTTGIVVGQVVSGVGVPLGATVVSIITNTSFVLSSAATATATVTLTFGGVITITGTNFDSILAGGAANIAVTFDGTSATSISVNSLKTIITCTPPAHAAGTITLLVTNASGLTASTNFVYDVEAVFTTAAGSLGGFVEAITYSADASAPRIQATEDGVALTTGFQQVTSATDDTVITTAINGLTLQTSGYLTGTLTAAANATTFPFYATAKDNENQRTAPRLFNIISYDSTATGGAVTTYGSYQIHTFNQSASTTFTLNIAKSCDILIVAGGGGGGGGASGDSAGGGAGGGMLVGSSIAMNTGAYTVAVGDGGSGGTAGSVGTVGANSSLTNGTWGTATANGGGYGGGNNANGGVGGSGGGGGGGGAAGNGGAANQGTSNGLTGYGYNGGNGINATDWPGGGGGGAGSAGGNASASTGGTAGASRNNAFQTNSNQAYSLGGVGNVGGHGAGVFAGEHFGRGGEAGGSAQTGADGGSGILVIRIPI